MKHRSPAAALAVTLAAVCLAAAPAAAAPVPDHFTTAESFVIEDFCGVAGLAVRLDIEARGTFVGAPRRAARLFYGQSMVRQTMTFTNTADDRAISYVGRFLEKDLSVTDNGDGTLTVLVLLAGGTRTLTGGGQVHAGGESMTYEVLIDHGGTPGDPSDDEFLGVVGAVRGSFTDGCPEILGVIS